MVDMAHYAGPRRRGRLSRRPVGIADFVTSTTHKTLRGPRGGFMLTKAEHEKAINSRGVPRPAGRPADARDRREGGGVRRGAAAATSGSTRSRCSRTRACWRRCCRSAACASSRAAPTRTCSSSTCAPSASPARTPRPRSRGRTSPSTRTRSRTIRRSRSSRPASASAARRSTTRGFGELECEELGHLIADVLDVPADDARRSRAHAPRVARADAQVPGLPLMTTNEMPVLRQRRHAGHRLARVRARRLDPPPPPVRRCQKRFTTYETVELRLPQVVKTNGDARRLRRRPKSASASSARCTSGRCRPSYVDAAIDRIVAAGAVARRARDRRRGRSARW